jgi:uncharacterized protein (TIGR00730 family)
VSDALYASIRNDLALKETGKSSRADLSQIAASPQTPRARPAVPPQFGLARTASLFPAAALKTAHKKQRHRMADRGKSRTSHRPQKAARTPPAPASALRNICVYCGSNPGSSPAYARAAETLGRMMAQAGIGLVYGGGGLGLMGELARAVIAHGGRVTGIIPAFLSAREHMLREADELIVVEDMHQRKKLMFDRSDAFVALPGGIGTLEELVEQLTWAQLGQHAKPIVLANIDGFWTPFLALLKHMHTLGFIRPDMDVRYTAIDRVEDVVPHLQATAVAQPADPTITEKF